MFEKEAEEYGIASREFCADVDDSDLIAEAYKDGAEFGYNKANKWHYVKDGKYPKEDCLVLYKDAMGNFSCSYIHPSHYIAGIELFFKTNPHIIAWKEIVLPKESK